MSELLQPLLSASGSAIAITLATLALAAVLIGIMHSIVTLFLGRLAPSWVNKVALLLQAAVIVGELAIISRFFAPGWSVVTVAVLLLALTVAALFSGHLLRARLLALRQRLRPSAAVATPDTVAAPLSQAPAPATRVASVALPTADAVAPLTRRPALGNLSTRRLNRG